MDTATNKHSARDGTAMPSPPRDTDRVARRAELRSYLGQRNAPTESLLELDRGAGGLELSLGLLGVFL